MGHNKLACDRAGLAERRRKPHAHAALAQAYDTWEQATKDIVIQTELSTAVLAWVLLSSARARN